MGITVRKVLSNGLKVGVSVCNYIFLLEPKLHAYAVTSFNLWLNKNEIKAHEMKNDSMFEFRTFLKYKEDINKPGMAQKKITGDTFFVPRIWLKNINTFFVLSCILKYKKC